MGSRVTSYPSTRLSAYFFAFFSLKASHIRKNEWLFVVDYQKLRQDELYRLAPQLTQLDLEFVEIWPRYWYNVMLILKVFSKKTFFFDFWKIASENTDSDNKKITVRLFFAFHYTFFYFKLYKFESRFRLFTNCLIPA